MKANRNSLSKVLRLNAAWLAVLLLCQCQMPTREAWQYIRTNGLLTYWGRPNPPFSPSSGTSQRYAYSRGGSYQVPRYGSRPLAYSYQRPYTPPQTPYLTPAPAPAPAPPPTRYPSRSYAAPSPPPYRVEEREEPTRPAPRPKPRREPPAVTRIPVDEPPPPARNESPKSKSPPAPSVATKSNGTLAAPAKPAEDLPYGTSVAGRPNMVNSPYAGKTQLVDVSGMTSGQTVKCPYTGKLFKVPTSQQASNNAESKLESKADTPKKNAEPKTSELKNSEPKNSEPRTSEPKDEEKKD